MDTSACGPSRAFELVKDGAQIQVVGFDVPEVVCMVEKKSLYASRSAVVEMINWSATDAVAYMMISPPTTQFTIAGATP